MKVTVSKSLLNKAIQSVNRIVEKKPTVPVLKGIKLETNEQGIQVTGCDSEMMIQYFIPASDGDLENMFIHTEGQCVLVAHIMSDFIKKITDDEIQIEIDDKYQGRIHSKKSDVKIFGYDPIEYPSSPVFYPDQSFVIQSDVLANLIRQTMFGVAVNESSAVLTGLFISLINGKLKFVATDRHRLASMTYEMNTEVQFQQLVVSSRAIVELSKLLPEETVDVEVMYKDNQILFRFGQVMLYAKLLDGTYPDTEHIIKNSANYTTELMVSTSMLRETIERASILSSQDKANIVKMYSLDDDTIEIFSSSVEWGKFKESLSTQKPLNHAIRVSFNCKYLLDILRVTDSEYIIFGFSGEMNPIFIKPEEGPDDYEIVHLMLPLRTGRES